MATIVILEHLMQKGLGHPYMVYVLAERWVKQGHAVLVHCGPDDPPPGDVAIVNIDLTLIPDAYVALFDRYPRVVNGATTNISKSAYSTLLVTQDSAWDGPVIAKTERNFGGRMDHRLRQRALDAGLATDIPEGPVMPNYPVFESIADVPAEAWHTHGIIIEKFLPEHDARGYYMRVWVFFGSQGRCLRMRSAQSIIKSHHILEREPVDVPPELHAWREELGFDYGKFDYVMRDDGPILIDANRTPGAPSGHRENPEIGRSMDLLASGIDDFL